MLLISVSISELSLLCFLAEKHLFKKENPFYLAKYCSREFPFMLFSRRLIIKFRLLYSIRKDKFWTSLLFLFYSNFHLLGIYTYALNQSVNSRIKSLMLFSRKALIQKRKSFLFDNILFLRISLYALLQKVNS